MSSRVRQALYATTILAAAVAATQACTVFLPWDGYAGDAADATAEGAPGADAANAADAWPEGALAAFEVPCGPGIACVNARACCAYGDGRDRDCSGSCSNLDEAGAILRCDSPSDCTPGAKCCASFRDAGALEGTFCSPNCAGSALRTCDPAFGARDCQSGSACTRTRDSGFALTFCELVRDL